MILDTLAGLAQSEEPVKESVDEEVMSSEEGEPDDGVPRAIFYRRTRRPKRSAEGKRVSGTRRVATTLGFYPNNPRHEMLPRLGNEANGPIEVVRNFRPLPHDRFSRARVSSIITLVRCG